MIANFSLMKQKQQFAKNVGLMVAFMLHHLQDAEMATKQKAKDELDKKVVSYCSYFTFVIGRVSL